MEENTKKVSSLSIIKTVHIKRVLVSLCGLNPEALCAKQNQSQHGSNKNVLYKKSFAEVLKNNYFRPKHSTRSRGRLFLILKMILVLRNYHRRMHIWCINHTCRKIFQGGQKMESRCEKDMLRSMQRIKFFIKKRFQLFPNLKDLIPEYRIYPGGIVMSLKYFDHETNFVRKSNLIAFTRKRDFVDESFKSTKSKRYSVVLV